MSYLRRLDQARARLGEGNLLAAEHELREATREWKTSRVRAPLVEKGIEPALRALGRVFGRKSDEPVLPVFPRRAELLREDLHAFARSLASEVLEDIAREDLPAERRFAQATEALGLQRSSEFFVLAPAREWEVVKVWLADARELGAGLRPELLPSGAAPDGDERWWLDWIEAWCGEPIEPVRPFADWARRLALQYAARSIEEPLRWAWVQARLAIQDPLSAPLALAPLERVLDDGGADPAIVAEALECWAGLVTNLRLLATPGGNARDVLEPRAMQAARLGLTWPPASIVHRLPERRPQGKGVSFVSVHAQDDGTAIALVLHDARRACDVLCIKPSPDPDSADPFSMDEGEAQRQIAAWLPPESVLLSAGEPGPRLRGLIGSAKWIPVRTLTELFGCGSSDALPAPPASTHPAWTREICAPWDTLVPAARRLVPALEGLLTAWPSLATGWGRANLRRLGDRGVPLADALADAAELVASPGAAVPLVESAPPLSLVWPRLEDRPWPQVAIPARRPAARTGSGRVWIDRKASAAELAAVAAAEGATNLMCAGADRALELAGASASATEAAQVALVGPEIPCASPLLDLLNRWVTESPGDLERGRASVWLLAVLGETVGPVDPLLEMCPDAGLVEEVHSRLSGCRGACGSHRDGACWPDQAEARVRKAHVTVVDVAAGRAVAPEGRRAVFDDLRSWVVGVDDAEALRRLAMIPSGTQSVVVFTPGVGFLVSLLGSMPACEGGDGGWRFVAGDGGAPPAIWVAPPGYGPGSEILARESRSLIEERARRWNSDVGEAPLWGEDLEDLGAALDGVVDEPSAPTVLVPSLGERDARSPLLLGLRLAAAASHASERVVCLSPILAEVLGSPGGLIHGDDDAVVPRALDSGSGLLGGRRGRPHATWTSPLTRPRLEQVGALRARELATALNRWPAGRGRVLAGVLERDRQAIVELIVRLQNESLDGGPLGIRSVVLVSPPADNDAHNAPPELRLRALGRGRRLVATLAVDELGDAAVEDWARRNPGVAWVFRNAESVLEVADPEPARRIFAALRRSQARALFLVDHAADARRIREFVNPHFATDPVTVIEDYAEGLDPGAWQPRTLGGLAAQCPECARSVVYSAAFELCPECGVPVDAAASVRRSLRVAFESRVVDALRQLGPQASWTLIVFDAARKSRLRQRLGLDGRMEQDAPLLSGTDATAGAEVKVPADLWRSSIASEAVIVVGVPSSVQEWEAVAGRLRAMGVPDGQWWLGPAGLDETEELPGAELNLEGRREQVLESFASADRVHGTATLRRLEAAGGSWEGMSHLRVHELVRSGHDDDAPLAALGRATRRGILPQETVAGLRCSPPARLERAMRSGVRLRRHRAAVVQSATVSGPIVGIAGFGKTTALLAVAGQAAARGESVLVIVPHPVGRLEWIERLSDPGVACLDFDEFLLDLVSDDPATGSRLRMLPPADLRFGEEVRLELVHRVSELYAMEAGDVPPLDSRSIIRALEGERLAADPVSARTNVDYELLVRSVGRAKAEGGWTGSRELLHLARQRGGRAAAFDVVLVDDVHDLPDSGLDFLRDCFGERLVSWAIDPVVGLVPESLITDEAMESHRFGPAIADAIERVWRATTPLPAPVRGVAPGRSVAESERILALTTATERISDELAGEDALDSVVIVAANERDRRMMAQQLSVRSIEVDGPDRDPGELVTGPREVLAALSWIASEPGETSTDLLRLVLAAGPEPGEADEAEHYEARLRRRVAGEDVEVLDRVEAFLLPLALVRGALGPSTRVDRAVEVLLGCGLLHRLTDQPGMVRRIENFVRQYRGLTVSELLDAIRVEDVLRPSSGGSAVRILAPDQLAGRVYGTVYYICTGFEPPERHYRVISRARSAVKIACSEVDPLQG